ncbi:hypothetical protein [Streptomyces sp. CA-106131]|uniref:hypothetical protein n=1 Tax=Streptomyces sp. CA-106131 TaxID=3240045 RepID=UPI003D8E661A
MFEQDVELRQDEAAAGRQPQAVSDDRLIAMPVDRDEPAVSSISVLPAAGPPPDRGWS